MVVRTAKLIVSGEKPPGNTSNGRVAPVVAEADMDRSSVQDTEYNGSTVVAMHRGQPRGKITSERA